MKQCEQGHVLLTEDDMQTQVQILFQAMIKSIEITGNNFNANNYCPTDFIDAVYSVYIHLGERIILSILSNQKQLDAISVCERILKSLMARFGFDVLEVEKKLLPIVSTQKH